MHNEYRWIKFGSAINNEEYIEKLLNKYNISNYRFTVNGYGDYDLYLDYGFSSYKISVKEIDEELWIYKKDIKLKSQKCCKDFFNVTHKTNGNDCWYEAIKYILKQERIN